VVGAKAYMSRGGHLFDPWVWDAPGPHLPVSVFCNPPNGKMGRTPMPVVFWENLIRYREEGYLKHAIFIGFNSSILYTSQSAAEPVTNFPVCFPRKRIAFVHGDTGHPETSPRHDNVIVYVGGTQNRPLEFRDVFEDLGACINVRV